MYLVGNTIEIKISNGEYGAAINMLLDRVKELENQVAILIMQNNLFELDKLLEEE